MLPGPLTFPVGEGLSADALLHALAAQRTTELLPIVPDLARHHANAALVADSLELDAVEPVDGRPNAYTLRFHYVWEAQAGCSDLHYRDTAWSHTRFAYADGHAQFPPNDDTTRSTVDEF